MFVAYPFHITPLQIRFSVRQKFASFSPARLPVASLDRSSISSASQKKEATQTLIETAKKILRTRAEVHRNFSPSSIFRARGPSSPSYSEMPVARKVGGGGKGRTSGEPAAPGLEEEEEEEEAKEIKL